jgi:hypothetical protein
MHTSPPVVELPLVLEALTIPVEAVVLPLVLGSVVPVLLLLSELDVVLVGTSDVLEVEPLEPVEVPVVGVSAVVPCVPEEPSLPTPPESPHAAKAGATNEIP